jgi:hypothetical protein
MRRTRPRAAHAGPTMRIAGARAEYVLLPASRRIGREPRADKRRNATARSRFQMCEYAVGFNAERVSLVYPTSVLHAQHRILLDTTFGIKRLVIDLINLPMHAGPKRCERALIEICGSLEQHRRRVARMLGNLLRCFFDGVAVTHSLYRFVPLSLALVGRLGRAE